MNRAGPSKIAALSPQEEEEAHVREVYEEWLASQWEDHVASRLLDGTDEVVFSNKKPQTLGYVTRDACHGKGDDIEHIPVPFSRDQVWVMMLIPSNPQTFHNNTFTASTLRRDHRCGCHGFCNGRLL